MRRFWALPLLLLAMACFAAPQEAPDLSIAQPLESSLNPLPTLQPAALVPKPSLAPIAILAADSAGLQAMPERERAAAIDSRIRDLDEKIRSRMKPGDLLHGTSLEDLRKIIADGFMRDGLPDDGYPSGVWAHQVTSQDRQAKYLQALLYAEGRAKHHTRSAPVVLRVRSTRSNPVKFSGSPSAMQLTRGQVRLENLELFLPASASWAPLGPGNGGPQRPSLRARLKRSLIAVHNALNGAPGTRQRVFKQSAALGLAVGAVAPVLWKATPLETLILALPAAIAIGLGVILTGTLVTGLAARAKSRWAKPSRRVKTALAVAGLALGFSLGLAPTHFQGPLMERAAAVYRPAYGVRYAGPAMAGDVEQILSQNPVGRQILTQLRDRGGVVRMPAFFVSAQDGTTAFHAEGLDAVFIDKSEITGRGWTVDQFVRSPDLQRQLAYQLQDVIAHELVHAAQARRPVFEKNRFKKSFELEKEAYLVEHFYETERLKADPHADIPGLDLGEYESILDGVDGYFDSMRGDGPYRDSVDAPGPEYLAYRARIDATWKAHRVEGYELLAKRYSKIPPLRERLERMAEKAARP